MTAPARLDAEHPWPGLASFTEDDQGWFRGRDREADDLARLVRRERLTVLFGRSGLGKTSLLGAGLFPRLRDEQHLPVLLRIGYGEDASPRQQVWRALSAACAANHVEAPRPEPGATLWEDFHRVDAAFWSNRNRPLTPVLVFDQFEEVFTVGQASPDSRATAAAFIDELACLVEDRVPDPLRARLDAEPTLAESIDYGRRGCKVVLSFREDFLADVEGLRERMPSLARNRYRLLPMNGTQAATVVAAGGALVDAATAARIVGLAWRNRAEAPPPDRYESLEIDPALLSVICSELNLMRLAAGSPCIGDEQLALGESKTLDGFYERSFEGEDPRLRAFVEDELITEGGFRDMFAFDDALSRPGVGRDGLLRLVEGRLLRIDERFGVRRLELTHDVLTRVVRASRDGRRTRGAAAAAQAVQLRAQAQLRRNRRFAALVGVAAVFAAGLLYAAVQAQMQVEESRVRLAEVKRVADAQEAKASAALVQLRQSQAMLEDYAKATAKAVDDSSRRRDEAEQAQQLATAKQAEAAAADLFATARLAQAQDPDLALLLGAEGVLRYRDRLSAQVDQFSRVLGLERVLRLWRVGSSAVAVSAGGGRLVVRTADNEMLVADTGSWTLRARWRLPEGDRGGVVIALSPDGRAVATTADTRLVLWDTASGREIGRGEWPFKPGQLVFAPDGALLAAGGRSVALRLPGGEIRRLPAVRDVSCIGFSADGRETRVGSVAATTSEVVGFDIATQQRLWSRDRPADAIDIVHSADCRLYALRRATGAKGGFHVVDVHDTRSGEWVATIEGRGADAEGARSLKLSSDGRSIAVDFKDGVQFWSFDTRAHVARLTSPEAGRYGSFSASADGRWLILHDDDQSLGVWRQPGDLVRRIAAADVGAWPWVHAEGDFAAVLPRGIEAGRKLWRVLRLAPAPGLRAGNDTVKADGAEFNRDGNAIALATPGGIALWRAGAGATLRRYDARLSEFSPRGSLVALTNDVTLEVRDLGAGDAVRLSHPLPPGDDGPWVGGMALRWDDSELAAGMTNGELWRWSLGSPSRRLPTLKTGAPVQAVAYSPDGRLLAAALQDGRVAVFSRGGERRLLAAAHRGKALRLAFSPDGHWLASGGGDGAALLHDLNRGGLAARFEPHDSGVTMLEFSADSTVLVSGDGRQETRVWDVQKGRPLGRLGGDGVGNGNVAVNPVSRLAAVIDGDDGRVAIRDWSSDALRAATCEIVARNLSCVEWRQHFRTEPYRALCPSAPLPDPPCQASVGRRGERASARRPTLGP